MRRWLTFTCDGARCAATLDQGARATGLLIVSGGNEIRSGAHRGMASLAAHVASAGYPVLRYDRRGIGDSEGVNSGYRGSAQDIAAAAACLRAEATVQRVVAFGNCDAATALALYGPAAGIDAVLLANPWTFDSDDGAVDDGSAAPDDAASPTTDTAIALPSAGAIRARYLARLKDPRQIWRLLSGGVDLRKLARGLRAARGGGDTPTGLAAELLDALAGLPVPGRILLATHDRTAAAFADAWARAPAAAQRALTMLRVDSASHGFADEAAQRWLHATILAEVTRLDRDWAA